MGEAGVFHDLPLLMFDLADGKRLVLDPRYWKVENWGPGDLFTCEYRFFVLDEDRKPRHAASYTSLGYRSRQKLHADHAKALASVIGETSGISVRRYEGEVPAIDEQTSHSKPDDAMLVDPALALVKEGIDLVRRNPGWMVEGLDVFSHEWYPIAGPFPTREPAEKIARKEAAAARQRSTDETLMDRVFLVHPNNRDYIRIQADPAPDYASAAAWPGLLVSLVLVAISVATWLRYPAAWPAALAGFGIAAAVYVRIVVLRNR